MKETIMVNSEIVETNVEISHGWPHIPKIQWEQVYGIISNTVISSFIFLLLVASFCLLAKRSLNKTWGKTKMFFLNIMDFFYKYLIDSFWNRAIARRYFPLIVWVFFVIFFWNIFWLIIDWLGSLTTSGVSSIVLYYLRPMNSDLNTTLVLGLGTIIYSLFISFKYIWFWKTVKWYFFNFSWKNIGEKIVNVFVGWLHLIGLPASVVSLSLRLFGNIFAWMILISVIWYLGYLMSQSFFEIWRVLTIPFWFFELFVAFVQAAVFGGLMIAYFKQSLEESH
jgi:F-type H+-transporting ATPase subunit a